MDRVLVSYQGRPGLCCVVNGGKNSNRRPSDSCKIPLRPTHIDVGTMLLMHKCEGCGNKFYATTTDIKEVEMTEEGPAILPTQKRI